MVKFCLNKRVNICDNRYKFGESRTLPFSPFTNKAA